MNFFLFKFLFLVLPVLIGVAFVTLLERKILGLVGIRVGPNKVSLIGLLQPLGDAFKLANKSLNYLSNFSLRFYYISSFLMIFLSLFLFSILFSFPSPLNLKFSFLFFFLILGFNSLNSILAGWRTFTKFSLIGSIRTVSQLVSYEGVLYLCVFFFILLLCSFDLVSFNFLDLNIGFILLLPCFYIWVPTFLAELNRTPYDFSEGERELVRGFNTEFGSSSFTLIFLAEYANILFFSILGAYFFFFSVNWFFLFFLFCVIWFRSILPRFRFDKLISLAWKFFIPFLTFFYFSVFFWIF